jgi:hypothetical protein
LLENLHQFGSSFARVWMMDAMVVRRWRVMRTYQVDLSMLIFHSRAGVTFLELSLVLLYKQKKKLCM